MSFTLSIRAGPAAAARMMPRAPQLVGNLAKSRAFHQSTPKNTFFSSRTASLAFRSNAKSANSTLIARLRGATRGVHQAEVVGRTPPPRAQLLRRLLVGGAVFGGTLTAINMIFNRETREGGMPAFERSYLNKTFLHTGAGLGIIGFSAYKMLTTGFVYRIMVSNPWVVGIGGMVLSIGTVMATRAIDPENTIPKYALWTVFNATHGAFIAPLMMIAPPAVLARAGVYTLAMMGGISFVGATAKQDKYLYIGGPLMGGLAIVIASSFLPLVVPATMVRTLAVSENIALYGGLAVFGGFTLYDVQKILYHARLAERGVIKADPVNESISLELDFLNIFIRMVQILMMQQRRK